ncbi:hypothetical protein ISCGN_018885 [Ixodes scapularis]
MGNSLLKCFRVSAIAGRLGQPEFIHALTGRSRPPGSRLGTAFEATSPKDVVQSCEQKSRRIDKATIGAPTDFQHTAHMGAGDARHIRQPVLPDSLFRPTASKGPNEPPTPRHLLA